MRMKPFLCASVLSLLFATMVAAVPELLAAYVDGSVQVQSGSTWKGLSIGDSVPTAAKIRLDQGASLQLSGMGSTISLRQKGTYDMKALLSARQAMGSTKVGTAIAGKMKLLLKGPSMNQSALAGVRGADESKSDDSGWVENGTQDAIKAAMDLIEAEKYGAAINRLTNAKDEATTEDLPELHYYLAYAYSQNGNTDDATKELANIQNPGGVSWTADYILLTAKLDLDGLAFPQAVAWLTQRGHDLSGDGLRAPLYYFLLGMGYRGVGDTANEKTCFSKVIAISGDSDLGKAAVLVVQE